MKFSLYLILALLCSAMQAEPTPDLVKVHFASQEDKIVYPGSTHVESLHLKNPTDEVCSLPVSIDLPEGWSLISEIQEVAVLPQSEKWTMLAIHIPKGAAPSNYQIHVRIGEDQYPLNFRVVEGSKILTTLEEVHKRTIGTNAQTFFLRVENSGNLTEKVDYKIESEEKLNTTFDQTMPITLKPGESRELKLTVAPKEASPEMRRASIFMRPTHEEGAHSLQLDIFPAPQTITKKGPLIYSGHSKLVADTERKKDDNKHQAFLENKGSGYIDHAETKKLDFLFRVPFYNTASVYENLGGTPEKFYVHYKQPHIETYGGDGIYTVSPLLLSSKFGRGFSAKAGPEPVEFGALYIGKQTKIPQRQASGYLHYDGEGDWDLMGSYLYTNGRPNDKENTKKLSANTASLYLKTKPDVQDILDLEFSLSRSSRHKSIKPAAYLKLETRSKDETFWATLQEIYADPNYVGYYRDFFQSNLAFGGPLGKVKFSVNGQVYFSNLKKDAKKEEAPRNINGNLNLSRTFNNGLWTQLSYFGWYSDDRLAEEDGYTSHYGVLSITQPIKSWNFVGRAELGGYHSKCQKQPNRVWQKYDLSLNYNSAHGANYSLYTKFGYPELDSKIHWTRSLGASVTWKIKDELDFLLNYEYQKKRSRCHHNYFNGRLGYTFKNGHTLELSGNTSRHLKCCEDACSSPRSKHHQDYKVLFAYTIPWNAKLHKRDKNNLVGRIYKSQENESIGYPDLLVRCGDRYALSDSQGNFGFDNLPEGQNSLWVEDTTEGYIAQEPLPIDVSPDGKSPVALHYVRPATLSGNISIYSFSEELLRDLAQNADQKVEQHPSPYQKSHPAEGAKVILTSQDGSERYEVTCDARGNFSFEGLRPTLWIVRFQDSTLAKNLKWEQENASIELTPGEKKEISFRILPVAREFLELK